MASMQKKNCGCVYKRVYENGTLVEKKIHKYCFIHEPIKPGVNHDKE